MSESTAGPGPQPVRPGRPVVLLADDEVALRHLVVTVLESHGYAVVCAEDSRRALEVFATAPERIALVILDKVMPGPGVEATLSRLRSLDPAVRVLLTSGYTEPELGPEIRQSVCGFLAKPFRGSELLRAVAVALARP